MYLTDKDFTDLHWACASGCDRFLLGIMEEAGEVAGAWNKLIDKRSDKPMTLADVTEELSQLLACCILFGISIGVNPSDLLDQSRQFAIQKTEAINHGRRS